MEKRMTILLGIFCFFVATIGCDKNKSSLLPKDSSYPVMAELHPYSPGGMMIPASSTYVMQIILTNLNGLDVIITQLDFQIEFLQSGPLPTWAEYTPCRLSGWDYLSGFYVGDGICVNGKMAITFPFPYHLKRGEKVVINLSIDATHANPDMFRTSLTGISGQAYGETNTRLSLFPGQIDGHVIIF